MLCLLQEPVQILVVLTYASSVSVFHLFPPSPQFFLTQPYHFSRYALYMLPLSTPPAVHVAQPAGDQDKADACSEPQSPARYPAVTITHRTPRAELSA